MTATLGTALVQSATLVIERYGIPRVDDIAIVDDDAPAVGTRVSLAIGNLSHVGTMVTGGSFGGQARASWVAGTGGWPLTLAARPYHDDNGIMLSAVLTDLERDAATAAGATPLGTVLEVPDVRIDAAGSWIRPSASGRDLLDALAVAAGQPRGAWWIATDGSTHLGKRPATTALLPDLTVDPFDPALLRGIVRVPDDGYATLLPGATLTANGLPAPLPIAALVVRVDDGDIHAEVWGEAGEAEMLARLVRSVMAPALAYLGAQPYVVAGTPATDGRVPVAAPTGSTFPDAPLLGHAPGIPGASFRLAVGAPVVVMCLAGSPGGPVCVAYPAGVLPDSVTFDATGDINVGVGGHYLARADITKTDLDALRQSIINLGGTVPLMADPACLQARGK